MLVTEVSADQAPVLSNQGGSLAIMLLGALARTLANWTRRNSVAISMEGHGREPVADGTDVDTTVGWFTSLFPLRIDLPEIDVNPEQALRCAQQAWRGVPRGGLGYGLLRYSTPDATVRTQLAHHELPPIMFNYLGWVGDEAPVGQLLGAVRHCPNHERSPRNRRPHLLEVSAWTDAGGIRLNWRYSSNRHHQATIVGLAQEMRATLIAMGSQAIGPTTEAPPDLGEDLGFDESGLDDLLTQLPD
jgi:non-ribosomal peptide synthase protein (TIGR01720 family)